MDSREIYNLNMSCLLCFGTECDENLIDIVTVESQRLNIGSILHTHFGFCFQEEPTEGFVCQKCWIKVSLFHEFYTHIEYVHRSNESIFVESIVDDIKPAADSDSERRDSVFPSESEWIDERPQNEPRRKRGRPRRQKSMKFEDTDNEIRSGDNFDTNFMDGPRTEQSILESEEIQVENQQQPDIVEKPKTKRKKSVISKDYISDEESEENSDDPTWNGYKIDDPNRPYKPQRRRNKLGTFQCKICEIHFLTFCRLDRHIKEMHDAKEFKCNDPKCVDSFQTQQLLDDHFANRHKRVECPHCKRMIIEFGLAQHIRSRHDASNNVCCELCGKVSLNKQMHKDHLSTTHQVVERLQCDICGQWYKNKKIMKSHMTRKHIYGPQTCSVCGKVLANLQAFREHKQIHIPETLDRWRCDVCGHGFRKRNKLKEHYHIHTGTVGSHQCNDCGKMFRFSSSFSVHKKTMHPK